MRRLEFFNGSKTYMYPNGELATPQKMQNDFPALSTFRHVIETDAAGEVCFAVENFSAMRTRYNIDKTLNDVDALEAIETIINEEPVQEPTAEERIASALEFQNMMMLPDEEV